MYKGRFMGDLLTSEQAASALGVTKATLYSYISRGFLRSVASPGEHRRKRYSRTDVELLKAKKDGLRKPLKSAGESLRFGLPVLETKITLIRDGKLFYRGQDATTLARENSLEQVAELLWDVKTPEKKHELKLWQRVPGSPGGSRARSIAELQIMLARLGSRDSHGCELHGTALLKTGAHIVQALAGALAGRSMPGMLCHERLGFAWSPGSAEAPPALRMALVLAADHELNASTFVARCAAAAGASPIDAVIAALSTLNGRRHGGQTAKAAQVFVEAERCGSVTLSPRSATLCIRTATRVRVFCWRLYWRRVTKGEGDWFESSEGWAAGLPEKPRISTSHWAHSNTVTTFRPAAGSLFSPLVVPWDGWHTLSSNIRAESSFVRERNTRECSFVNDAADIGNSDKDSCPENN
jgi:excisionase family DNA binding protein